MNAYSWLAVHDTAGFLAGAYLVVNDSPWWAALCFLMVATAKVETNQQGKPGDIKCSDKSN